VANRTHRDWALSFRRWLDENQQHDLRKLRDMISAVPLSLRKDEPLWKWEKQKNFSVKSTYDSLCGWSGTLQQGNLESQNPSKDKNLDVVNKQKCNSH